MKRTYAQATTRSISVTKLVGGVAAVGLHLLVLSMVFLVPSNDMVEPSLDEGTEVYFVELADVVDDVAHIAVEQPVVDVEAPLEPVVEPPLVEPEQAEVLPEPELISVSESVPESEPVAALKPQPPPKPQIKPPVKPAAKPVTRPTPVAAPKQMQAPVSTPSTTSPSAMPDKHPRMVSTVDYLGKRPMPVYPRASQRRQEQGRVVVRVVISPQGSVLDVQVHSSSGFERLDQAAVKAVRSARFKPYTENGIAYRAMADLPFDFVL